MKIFLISQKIGQKITYYRKLNGLTLEQLSKVSQVSQQQQSRYERGINRISIEKLIIYSNFFNVDIVNFFPLTHSDDSYYIIENEINCMNNNQRFK